MTPEAFLKLLQPPRFAEDEASRVAAFLHIITLTTFITVLVTAGVLVVTGKTVSALALGAVLLVTVLVYLANRAGRVHLASSLLLAGIIIGLTLVLAFGQGIHDIGIINYGLILIVASYLLNRRGILLVTSALIASAGVLVFGEFYGWLPVQNAPEKFAPEIADFFIVSLFLSLGGVAIFLLSTTLHQLLEKTRQAELRWRSLINSLPDTVVLLNREGIIETVYGLLPGPTAFYIGKSAFALVPPGANTFSEAELRRVLNGETLSGEMELLTSQGQTRWYWVSIGPRHQPDGRIDGAIAVVRSIQEKKDAEAELERSREALRARSQQLEQLQETSRARAERLAALNEIGRSISVLRDLNSVLESAYHLLCYVLPLDAFYIALYDPDAGAISYPIVIDGGRKWEEPPTPLLPNAQLTRVILTGEAYLVNRSAEEIAQRQANLQAQHALGDAEKVSASVMIVPLQFGGKVLGALSAQSYTLNAYTYDDLELLAGAATQIAIAIENARLYTALEKELAERKRAEAAIRTLNAELEARVRARTRELEAANKELASFTYTVSHDLRAPLRGIHGLTHIFLEDYQSALPPQAIALIQRIQENAHQMGRLIDELLTFTHLGRQAIHQTDLDMEALTHAVISDLMKTEARPIEFIVHALPHAHGDVSLLRQALTNLLSNAIKFSSKQEHPRIEVGSFEQEGETVYFIRDNGVGFDMAFAGKLFGVFERLHRQDEFTGSGVGLAIVKRIINKHGGRIWAEGKVDQGATFFFTLPKKPTKPENQP